VCVCVWGGVCVCVWVCVCVCVCVKRERADIEWDIKRKVRKMDIVYRRKMYAVNFHTLFLVLVMSLQFAVHFVHCHCSLLASLTEFNPCVEPDPH